MSAYQREAPEQHDDIDGIAPPAEVRSIVGHEAARVQLAQAARSGRLHHAWLFQGPRGVGKASVAFDFARRLLASTPGEGLPHDVPENLFRQVAQAGYPNLQHISRPVAEKGGGFRTQITVDGIRRLNHFFHTTAGGAWRVAIIDPVDDLNRNAANALLKILEEPPERSVFLLVNHQPGRLLATIRSRCRVLRFGALELGEVAEILAPGVPGVDAEDRREAAERAEGSARAAYQLLLAGGLDVYREVARLYDGEPDWTSVQKLGDTLTAKGREAAFEQMTTDLFQHLAHEAERRQRAGERSQAADLASYWQSEQARWREGLAFNLDRKQMLLTFFAGLERVRSHRK